METQGWKTVIQPLIDKMITDSMGCKKDGLWSEGALADCNKAGIEVEKVIWYRKALIEFNNSIHQVLLNAEKIRKNAQKQKEKNETKSDEVIMPMHDVSYKNGPDNIVLSDKYSGGLTSG